jgi:DNA-binding CsgD family transcriptional regulator/tetratricopeptide (TPR) repeat protein
VSRDTDDAEGFTFRHALVREALYDDLLPGERTAVHARFADALESDAERAGSASLAAELAYHWHSAHDVPRALEASVKAGTTAENVYAFADAHAQFERALELWDRVPAAESRTGLDRAGLLERAAGAAAFAVPPRAAALIRDAIGLIDQGADPIRAGVLHERLGRYSWIAGDGVTALAAHREAMSLVPATPPSIARARVTAGLCQILMIQGPSAEAKHICDEAVAVARAIGAQEIEGHALNSLGVTTAYLGELDGGLANLREAQRIGLTSDNVDDVARANANLVDVLNNAGRFAEAASLSLEAFEYAEDHGLAAFYGTNSLCEGASALQRLGRWVEAARRIELARRYEVSGVPEIFIQQRLAVLDVGQGRHERAASRIARLRRLCEHTVEVQWVAPLAEAAGELALWQGRPGDARRDALDGLSRFPIMPGKILRIGPLYAIGMRAEADLAANVRRNSKAAVAEASTIAEQYLSDLSEVRDQIARGLPPFVQLVDAYWSVCTAEFGRLRGANDPTHWSLAARAFAAIPMAYPRAYALWREAEAILASSRARVAASRPLHEAHTIAGELGAEPLAGAIEALASRARIDIGRVGPPSAPHGLESFGLTAREREVLELVAAGRTNRQIASALFITEKTASVHVSNILGKLDAKGRTEAASIAHRFGPGADAL